jgi:hypothetical protein
MVGHFPLPAFIALVMFGPFVLSFIFWVAYRKTIAKCINNRRLQEETQEGSKDIAMDRDVEMQVRGFVKPDYREPGLTRIDGIGIAV